MSTERAEAIVIEEEGIDIPAEVVGEIMEMTGLTREELEEQLPFNLGRGVPPFVNKELIELVDTETEAGHYTYAGPKHPDVDDKNAFRGAEKYISHVLRVLAEEYGVYVNAKQILTGSGGGQELVTLILEHQIIGEGRRVATTGRTFDRTKKMMIFHLNKEQLAPIRKAFDAIEKEFGCIDVALAAIKDAPESIKQAVIAINKALESAQVKPDSIAETADGNIDMNSIREYFERDDAKKTLFLVPQGSNPDGKTIPVKTLEEICEVAKKNNGTVVLDGAYARLYFEKEHRTDLGSLQDYLDDNTLSMVFTSTKEGGKRDAAFAVGSEDFMEKVLDLKSNKSLSPDYDAQIKQVVLETITEEELEELGMKDVLTFEKFLEEKIRTHLSQNFATVMGVLTAADMELSNDDVTHGYNVSVLLPEGDVEKGQFFTKLKSLGVNSPDLSSFSLAESEPGFRIPFGGFSNKECEIFCTLIVHAYREVYQ